MTTLALSTGPVAYTEHGHGAPIVLLHANPGDGQDYAAVIPALAAHHRVLAPDWPGYGASPPPPDPDAVTPAWLLTVLLAFLEALALPPAILIGNSVGGQVAARLALAAPARVRGLVLVAPGGFTPHTPLTRAFCALQGSRWSLPPAWFARMYLRVPTPTVAAMRERAATRHAAPACRALNRALWRSFARPENDLREVARGITAPTLLLFGAHDPAISATRDGAAAARALPRAARVTLPCGHAPFAEVPERFLAEVLPFVARCGNA